jgi:hypothetical protein
MRAPERRIVLLRIAEELLEEWPLLGADPEETSDPVEIVDVLDRLLTRARLDLVEASPA